MTVTIRAACADDAPNLPGIERAAGALFRSLPDLAWLADSDPLPEHRHRTLIAAGTEWVAENSGAPVGFLAAEAIGGELHIVEISVAPDQQGRGLGRGLIDAAIRHAQATGLQALTLTTFRDVRWNGPYYRRLGFQEVPTETLGERLAAILTEEERHGLPRARRCAMRLTLACTDRRPAP